MQLNTILSELAGCEALSEREEWGCGEGAGDNTGKRTLVILVSSLWLLWHRLTGQKKSTIIQITRTRDTGSSCSTALKSLEMEEAEAGKRWETHNQAYGCSGSRTHREGQQAPEESANMTSKSREHSGSTDRRVSGMRLTRTNCFRIHVAWVDRETHTRRVSQFGT